MGGGGGDNSAAMAMQQQQMIMQILMFNEQKKMQEEQQAKQDAYLARQEELARQQMEDAKAQREEYRNYFQSQMSASSASTPKAEPVSMGNDTEAQRKLRAKGTRRFVIPLSSASTNSPTASTEAGLNVPA